MYADEDHEAQFAAAMSAMVRDAIWFGIALVVITAVIVWFSL